MDNLAEQKEVFVIDDDRKAEWAINKIKEAIKDCDKWVEHYTEQIKKVKESKEQTVLYFESQLAQYFNTVPHKATKTQESYKLPSGTLKLKQQQPEYIRDDGTLISWLKSNYEGYVETVEKAKWGELKKIVTVTGDKLITMDGEIVEGVTVQERPPVFSVEVE